MPKEIIEPTTKATAIVLDVTKELKKLRFAESVRYEVIGNRRIRNSGSR
jgi:hypothetical protein